MSGLDITQIKTHIWDNKKRRYKTHFVRRLPQPLQPCPSQPYPAPPPPVHSPPLAPLYSQAGASTNLDQSSEIRWFHYVHHVPPFNHYNYSKLNSFSINLNPSKSIPTTGLKVLQDLTPVRKPRMRRWPSGLVSNLLMLTGLIWSNLVWFILISFG